MKHLFWVVLAVFLLPVVSAQSLDVQSDSSVAGFKRVRVSVEIDTFSGNGSLEFHLSESFHSAVVIIQGQAGEISQPKVGEWYDDCWTSNDSGLNWTEIHRDENGQAHAFYSSPQTLSIRCDLTGISQSKEDNLSVRLFDENQELDRFDTSIIALTADVLPPPPDSSPIIFAIGSIALTIIALFGYLRWKDRKSMNRHGLAFVLPAFLALVLLSFYPVAYGMVLSFTDAHEESIGDEEFSGLENYLDVFTSGGFLRVLFFTLIWTFTNVIFHVGIGGALAMLLQQKVRGKLAYRTLLLLPWAIPSYISVLVWKGMFHPEGLVNILLGTETDFFSGVSEAQTMVILVNIWLGVPFMMMSISGALQSIPEDLHEAAKVEGVSDWARLRHITIPLLKPTVVPLALMGFIWTFNMFNVIFLLTNGGPQLWFGEPGGTDILITYVYDVAFVKGELGLAAAWSVVIFIMLMVFSWAYTKGSKATEAVV